MFERNGSAAAVRSGNKKLPMCSSPDAGAVLAGWLCTENSLYNKSAFHCTTCMRFIVQRKPNLLYNEFIPDQHPPVTTLPSSREEIGVKWFVRKVLTPNSRAEKIKFLTLQLST